MKKIVLSLLCVVCLSSMATLKAQDNKMWAGGAISFRSTDDGSADRIMKWEFSPQWGMMINENWGAGVELSVDGWKQGDSKSDSWSIRPYARRYMAITDNFKFFGDGVVGFGKSGDNSTLDIYVRPGFQYWFAPKWSMATTFGALGYFSASEDMGAGKTKDVSSFGLDFTPASVSFGLYFHF